MMTKRFDAPTCQHGRRVVARQMTQALTACEGRGKAARTSREWYEVCAEPSMNVPYGDGFMLAVVSRAPGGGETGP